MGETEGKAESGGPKGWRRWEKKGQDKKYGWARKMQMVEKGWGWNPRGGLNRRGEKKKTKKKHGKVTVTRTVPYWGDQGKPRGENNGRKRDR